MLTSARQISNFIKPASRSRRITMIGLFVNRYPFTGPSLVRVGLDLFAEEIQGADRIRPQNRRGAVTSDARIRRRMPSGSIQISQAETDHCQAGDQDDPCHCLESCCMVRLLRFVEGKRDAETETSEADHSGHRRSNPGCPTFRPNGPHTPRRGTVDRPRHYHTNFTSFDRRGAVLNRRRSALPSIPSRVADCPSMLTNRQ